MSRKFKFRIWDKGLKNFLPYSCYLNHLDANEFTCFDRQFKMNEEDCVIQQFTGVLDQNNKEIYEGDIVYLNYLDHPEIDSKNLFEIIFERGCFQLKPIKLSPPPNGGNGAFSWMKYIEGWDEQGYEKYRYELPPPRPICDFNIMVVVGNVFENPELLK